MFSRFKTLQNFGNDELELLQDSKVAVVGLGATGSVIAEHLARHGVNLIIIDRDYLEEKDTYSSNLYTPEQCEKAIPKAVAAEENLSEFTDVEAKVESLKPGNIEMLDGADLIMDGTDNLETRFLINDYSKKNGVPWIYTAALAENGYSMMFKDKCFNCLFEEIPGGELDTCETAGILREVSSIAGSLSAMKAVKYLAGKEVEETLDTVGGQSFEVGAESCEICRGENFPHLEEEFDTVSVCGENKYQLEREIGENAFEKVRETGQVEAENDFLIRANISGNSFVLFKSGRAIIEAKDKGHAESLFSEVVGI